MPLKGISSAPGTRKTVKRLAPNNKLIAMYLILYNCGLAYCKDSCRSYKETAFYYKCV